MEYELFPNALLQPNLTMFTTISTFMCIFLLSDYRMHFNHCDRAFNKSSLALNHPLHKNNSDISCYSVLAQ